MLKDWDDLPEFMQCPEVKEYYDILKGHRLGLRVKRIGDLILAWILLVICAIPMAIIAIRIKRDSEGDVFYRQERVTTYGKRFRIHKFRTMVANADQIGSAVTVSGDSRVTKIGGFLRKYRLDELPQLLDVISGDMSFVGTRPEASKYVEMYTPEMNATLLLPAGITSEASIRYKDEAALLDAADDVDKVYMEQVLPEKMKWNLKSVKEFRVVNDFKTMGRTLLAVLGKDY
jgi:lipopolysaccharide/colanic/teichoic acid biosynthesis glycosyltransferase